MLQLKTATNLLDLAAAIAPNLGFLAAASLELKKSIISCYCSLAATVGSSTKVLYNNSLITTRQQVPSKKRVLGAVFLGCALLSKEFYSIPLFIIAFYRAAMFATTYSIYILI